MHSAEVTDRGEVLADDKQKSIDDLHWETDHGHAMVVAGGMRWMKRLHSLPLALRP